MPFAHPFPRAFSVASVRTHAPAAPGIYGVSNARHWIFIEWAADIQGALLKHLSEDKGDLNALSPTGFTFELCDAATQSSRQNRLVMEYEPVVNRLHRR
jgi:hypothetical protein